MAETNTPLRVPRLTRCAVTACLLVTASSLVLGEDRTFPSRYAPHTTTQSYQQRAVQFEAEAAGELRRDLTARNYPARFATTTPGDTQAHESPASHSTPSAVASKHESAAGPAAPSYNPPAFGEQTDFRALLSRVLVATVGVLIACCASIWLAKRFLSQSLVKPSADASLKILATLAISRRGCIQLVQADDTRLVVAVDGGTLKSVIPLTESFGKAFLDQVEDPATKDVQSTKAKMKTI